MYVVYFKGINYYRIMTSRYVFSRTPSTKKNKDMIGCDVFVNVIDYITVNFQLSWLNYIYNYVNL